MPAPTWTRLPELPAHLPLSRKPRWPLARSSLHALHRGGIGLYREGPLRALVQVDDFRVEPDDMLWLRLRVLAQACPVGRPPLSLGRLPDHTGAPVLEVDALLSGGMGQIWRLFLLNATTLAAGREECVTSRLVSRGMHWWAVSGTDATGSL